MNDRESINKLINLLNPYKRKIIIILFSMIISTVIGMVLPLISRNILDNGLVKEVYSVVLNNVLIMFILIVVDKSLNIWKEKNRINIFTELNYNLYEKAYNHLTKLRFEYFDNVNHTELLNNISYDVDNISKIADGSLFFVITQVFGLVGGIIGLIIIDYKLTVIVCLFIPIKFFIVNYFAKIRKKVSVEQMNRFSEFSRWFGDTIEGIKEIKLFNISANKHDEFEVKKRAVVNIEKKYALLEVLNMSTDTIAIQLLVTIIYLIGANMVFMNTLTIGSIMAFITYTSYVTSPISTILNINYILSGIIPSAKRYYQFLDLDIEKEKKATISLSKLNNASIEFKNISFSYNNGISVLKNINFKIESGERIAIIGHNASGKTTLLNLLLKLYDPTSGQILVSGIDIEDIKDYRNYISVVSQYVYLFNTTIKENVELYSDIDENKYLTIKKECRLENLEDSIQPESKVGQNGAMLSGGQRQKVALARALVRDTPIYIFDEVTANLDNESESAINNILQERLKEKTVLLVTHRTDVLKIVDKVLLIDNGSIVYFGKYESLQRNSNYNNMINEISLQNN